MAITRFDRDAEPVVVATELERNGCAIVETRAASAVMDALHAQLQPHLDAAPFGRTDFAGHTSRRCNSLLAKSTTCQQLAIDPLVLDVCERVLGPWCVTFRLHVTALIELHPGERRQKIHRDGDIYPLRHPAPPTTLSAFWACTDFSVENGATLVAPGSHRWPHDRQPRERELVNAVMPRGSVLLYTSSVWHGSDANRSSGVRTGMALHYNLGWLRQEENQLLSSPPAVARHFPERLQRLIGYDLGGPYLGFIEAGNPRLLLDEREAADMARSSTELEARAAALKPIPFGNIAPVAD